MRWLSRAALGMDIAGLTAAYMEKNLMMSILWMAAILLACYSLERQNAS